MGKAINNLWMDLVQFEYCAVETLQQLCTRLCTLFSKEKTAAASKEISTGNSSGTTVFYWYSRHYSLSFRTCTCTEQNISSEFGLVALEFRIVSD